ncbi:hypothetical protein PILCRDRAFT_826759 [Piloderma croceum F 1598]|uniref:Uncharacterized protein n=1 Tax=Piloderma croceum (strain F 1598) TaxID=765440 RepID=A0A0C3ETR5_PILCF|nr:hypothetical protein PILCRDRAFT_826759 [Piloderma croceum F 1598]
MGTSRIFSLATRPRPRYPPPINQQRPFGVDISPAFIRLDDPSKYLFSLGILEAREHGGGIALPNKTKDTPNRDPRSISNSKKPCISTIRSQPVQRGL